MLINESEITSLVVRYVVYILHNIYKTKCLFTISRGGNYSLSQEGQSKGELKRYQYAFWCSIYTTPDNLTVSVYDSVTL
jgi:hypothetical protein